MLVTRADLGAFPSFFADGERGGEEAAGGGLAPAVVGDALRPSRGNAVEDDVAATAVSAEGGGGGEDADPPATSSSLAAVGGGGGEW